MIRAPIIFIALLALAALWPANAAQTGATDPTHAPQCCRRSGSKPAEPKPNPNPEAGRRSGDPNPTQEP